MSARDSEAGGGPQARLTQPVARAAAGFLTGAGAFACLFAWIHETNLLFGGTLVVYGAVGAAFAAALGIGATVSGRRFRSRWQGTGGPGADTDSAVQPMRVMTLILLSAGGLAALSTLTIPAVADLLPALRPRLPAGNLGAALLGFAGSAVLFAPSGFVLGMGLPAVVADTTSRGGRVVPSIGAAAAWAAGGGGAACALAALSLMTALGVSRALLLAALAFVLAAAAAWASPARPAAPRSGGSAAFSPEPLVPIGSGAWFGFLLTGLFIAWARLIQIYGSHDARALPLLLCVLLVGVAIGCLVGEAAARSGRPGRHPEPGGPPSTGRRRSILARLGTVHLCLGAVVVAGMLIAPAIGRRSLELAPGDSSLTHDLLAAVILVLPAAVLLGALIPLASAGVGAAGFRERAGRFSGEFILGCAEAAAIAAVFMVLIKASLGIFVMFLVGSCVIIGGLTLRSSGRARLPAWSWAALGVATVLAGVVRPPHFVGAYHSQLPNLVLYEDGWESSVAVFDYPGSRIKVTLVNGRPVMRNDIDELATEALLAGHLPALFQPLAQDALVLGARGGLSAEILLAHGVPRVDVVDRSAAVFAASAVHFDLHADSAVTTHTGDHRDFLRASDHQYDIIVADGTEFQSALGWTLFTGEFYALVDQRLSPSGVFLQSLPDEKTDESTYRAILRTAFDRLPNISLWSASARGGSGGLLLATRSPVTAAEYSATLERAGTSELALQDLGPPGQIGAYLIMNQDDLYAYVGGGPVLNDRQGARGGGREGGRDDGGS